MSFDTISVVGLGYIGLPTAAVFASRKINVIGVDISEHAVETINKGEIHIVEPDLDMVVHAAVKEGYLRAVMKPESADAFLIAVPTPFTEGNKPDLSFIRSACDAIAPVLSKGNLIVLESTSPVGATEKMADWLAEARPDLSFPQQSGEDSDVRIAHCPERVLPGNVLYELVHNDRVIGGMTQKCSELAAKLYNVFLDGECVITNSRTAELAKLTENSFRDVNIAFANELSLICDEQGVNVRELISLANRHPRVNILSPGAGVGGHCIAVDPWFIVDSSPDTAKLIRTARNVNDYKPMWVVSKIKDLIKTMENPVVAYLGLSFKANIDDLRESPSLQIVEEMEKEQCGKILVVEPNISVLPPVLKQSALTDLETAMKKSDILVVLVKHKEFVSNREKIISAKGKLLDFIGLVE